MNLLRCATHTVTDANAAAERFTRWLGYRVAEHGEVGADLAAAWGAPMSAGRRYVVCRPASGADVFVRFIEGEPVETYRPMRSYGWAVIEICVQDVLAVNAGLSGSPFEIIGPPAHVPGLPTIFPMQIKGPDQEVLFLTEIITEAPHSGLPKAASLVDHPFILVLACADMGGQARWFGETLRLDVGAPLAIAYDQINDAFGLPRDQRHEIATARYRGDVFLEFDQYPPPAEIRPRHPGQLPPGLAICTLAHPDLSMIQADWIAAPVVRNGALYQGRRTGVLTTPEGALVEIIEEAGIESPAVPQR